MSDSQLKKKPKLEVALNEAFKDESLRETLSSWFTSSVDFESCKNISAISKPFKVCYIDDFLCDDGYLDNLEKELFDLPLNDKNNDLYKFQQSDDLQSFDTPCITALRSVFANEFYYWLKAVTQLPFSGVISMSYSRYSFTDTLLCHDDELEGRIIAYIYYLVSPEWKESDGGALELFQTDPKTGAPTDVVKSLIPRRNRILFFEVTEESFHQVAEVLSEDRVRHSIVGWFNGECKPRRTIAPPAPRPPLGTVHIEEELLRKWVNPMYLTDEIASNIQKVFEDESQIQLTNFLEEDRYREVCEALRAFDSWSFSGPPDRRRVRIMDLKSPQIPPIVDELAKLMRSEAMFLVLSNMTGLRLHPLAPCDDDEEEQDGENSATPSLRCREEVRRWSWGSYTLVHDGECDVDVASLDASLYFDSKGWEDIENGGFTSYVADDEDLITISPSENCLNLVYREGNVARFVKHINRRSVNRKLQDYFDLSVVYYE